MRKQNGSVLVLALVVLMILSLLSVTGMRAAMLDQKMAANSKFHAMTFQAADSVLSEGLGDADLFSAALTEPDGISRTNTVVTGDGRIQVETNLTVEAVNTRNVTGFSIGAYSGYPFELRGTASIPSVAAKSKHVLGVEKIGPGN